MKAVVNAFANIWSTMLSLLGLLGVYLVLVALLGMMLFRTRWVWSMGVVYNINDSVMI